MHDRFSKLIDRCVKRFGVRATYIRGESEHPLRGIFDSDHEEVTFEGNAPIATRGLSFGIDANDLPFAPKKGDRVKIRGKLYKVFESQPDSESGIVLILKEG
jgi:hypothetical protein